MLASDSTLSAMQGCTAWLWCGPAKHHLPNGRGPKLWTGLNRILSTCHTTSHQTYKSLLEWITVLPPTIEPDQGSLLHWHYRHYNAGPRFSSTCVRRTTPDCAMAPSAATKTPQVEKRRIRSFGDENQKTCREEPRKMAHKEQWKYDVAEYAEWNLEISMIKVSF